MTILELHPDDLLEGDRCGVALSAHERSRLDAHLRECATCRFTQRVANDFDEEVPRSDQRETNPGDKLGPLVATVVRHMPAPARTGPARRVASGRAHPLIPALAVSFLLVAGAATAAQWVGGFQLFRSSSVAPPAATTSTPRARKSRLGVTPNPVAGLASPAPPQPSPSLPKVIAKSSADAVAVEVEVAAVTARDVVPALAVSTVVVPVPATTASELFAQANAARRAGDFNRASAQYDALWTRFKGTAEARTSRALFGRLLLHRGNAAAAIRVFDDYLAWESGDLRQEVIVGRAIALERLGRTEAERATWNSLLKAFPQSAYAARARGRLEALRPRGGSPP